MDQNTNRCDEEGHDFAPLFITFKSIRLND